MALSKERLEKTMLQFNYLKENYPSLTEKQVMDMTLRIEHLASKAIRQDIVQQITAELHKPVPTQNKAEKTFLTLGGPKKKESTAFIELGYAHKEAA